MKMNNYTNETLFGGVENIINNGTILPKAQALINKKHTLLKIQDQKMISNSITSTDDGEEFQVERHNLKRFPNLNFPLLLPSPHTKT